LLQRQGCGHIADRYRPGFAALLRIRTLPASQRMGFASTQRSTLKDEHTSKRPGRNTLIRPLRSEARYRP
jgi:hypothetical protein